MTRPPFDPFDDRSQRRVARELRKSLRRERRYRRRGPRRDVGIVQLVFAAVLVGLVVAGVIPWWGVFISFGLAMGGARKLAEGRRAREEARAEAPETTAEPVVVQPAWEVAQRERLQRVDERLDQLRMELKQGPSVLREIVRRPDETLEGLKKGARALAERESALRKLITPEEDARLARERGELTQRLDAETDALTRQRLEEALTAIDQHRQERSAVSTAANRLEAEQTRLLYSLETLHAQVLRARSMDAATVAVDASLRQGLERLTEEVGAVAEALESVTSTTAGAGPAASARSRLR